MAIGLRLKGQEVSIIVIAGGNVVQEVKAVSNLNDETKLDIKEDGFLGETANEYDQVYNGMSGDFEMQLHRAQWETTLKQRIINKARRIEPNLVFNVVRIDFYPNGDTVTTTFTDVSWGAIPRTTAARGDFVKVKFAFACSEAPVSVNAFI